MNLPLKNKKKKLKLTTLAFTLVELLAVIVILAIILVIAVPQIMNTISSSKSSSLETSAKLIADAAEKEYVTETILETLDPSQEIRCSDVTKINNTDYSSCSITFDEQGKAYVTIVGSGKFDGLRVCDATKED